MVAPLVPSALRGFLWYQGEADVSRAAAYRELLPRLITSWRDLWAQGDTPFLLVQLPGHGRDTAPVAGDGIPFLREAQASALRLPAVGVVVTADIGDAADVHPDNKTETAARLALAARQIAYGEKVAGVSPRYRSHTVDGATVRVRFTDVGAGLAIGAAPWRPKGVEPLPTDRVLGFFLAGADGKWVEATATIEGADTVALLAPGLAAPVAVRYGWAYTPRLNLYSRDGLPVAPFRTDDWPR
jgi:sialate O-acetylesterase